MPPNGWCLRRVVGGMCGEIFVGDPAKTGTGPA